MQDSKLNRLTEFCELAVDGRNQSVDNFLEVITLEFVHWSGDAVTVGTNDAACISIGSQI